MKPYKEKRKESNLEIRTCINCGEKWYVRKSRYKSTVRNTEGRVFCDECVKKLTAKEKQHLYRIHSEKYHEEKRICPNCGTVRTVDVKNDVIVKRRTYFCDACNSILSLPEKKRILKATYPEYKERYKKLSKESYRRNFIHNMVSKAKQRAKKYGYEFNIENSDIQIPELCPILEVSFVLGDKGNYEYTPTIDRIDNTKGYTKDNIQIITKKANSMKNSASIQELKTFCKNILRYSLTTTEKECGESKDKEP